MQGSENFWEGSDEQGIHWAISDDGGASWGAQESLVPAPDSLPAWGPVLHTEVRSPAIVRRSLHAIGGQLPKLALNISFACNMQHQDLTDW